MTGYCPRCGTKNTSNNNSCGNCDANLTNGQSEQKTNKLSKEQLRQKQLENIWAIEKTVPKWLRGSWQANLSYCKLEQGLTESEKQYLRHRRDTE